MSQPVLVSVLMTAYNRQAFIAEAIESVLASTYPHFELIIVDDGSRDDTVAIAESYAAKDNRIKVYINEQNLGQFANRNKAASLAKGTYLMHADSDDTLFSDVIEKCVEVVLKFPDVGFGMYLKGLNKEFEVLDNKESVFRHFFKTPFLMTGPGSTIITKDLFEKIGGFPTKYSVVGDLYYNLNAASHSKMILLPFEFVNYRIHDQQELNNHFDYLWGNYLYLAEAVTRLPLELTEAQKNWILKKNKRRFLSNIVKYYLATKNLKQSLVAIRRANYTFINSLEGIFQL